MARMPKKWVPGWRVTRTVDWPGRGDLDHVLRSPSGKGFVIETKTLRYSRAHVVRLRLATLASAWPSPSPPSRGPGAAPGPHLRRLLSVGLRRRRHLALGVLCPWRRVFLSGHGSPSIDGLIGLPGTSLEELAGDAAPAAARAGIGPGESNRRKRS